MVPCSSYNLSWVIEIVTLVLVRRRCQSGVSLDGCDVEVGEEIRGGGKGVGVVGPNLALEECRGNGRVPWERQDA